MTLPAVSQIDTLKQLVVRLLDKGYVQAAGQTVTAIARNAEVGVLPVRLQQLDAEAARLAATGEKFSADNPVVRALLADFDDALRRDAALVDGAAGTLQQAGQDAARVLTRELALPGVTPGQLSAVGVSWNTPDPEALARVVELANKPAWQAMQETYQAGIGDVAKNVVVRGIAQGWGPLRAARELRGIVEALPQAQAANLMRTTQLTSYRQAAAANQLANADILEEQIRIATLDGRTCLACVALHGKRYPVGAVIDDHYSGRCIGIPVVKGRPRSVTTGEDWLKALPEDRQRALMGPSAYAAWAAGEVQLQDFVHRHTDEVFGPMVSEASLKSLGIQRLQS